MRKALLLVLVLVVGLIILSGCENATNPMEVESYHGSTELTTQSEDTTKTVTLEIVNSEAQGNLVFKFYHDGLALTVNSIKFDDIEAEIVNYNFIEPRSITHVVISPNSDIMSTESTNILIDTTVNFQYNVVLYSSDIYFGESNWPKAYWDLDPNTMLYGVPIYQGGKTLGGTN